MAAKHCANCNAVMGSVQCQSCGWKPGDPISRDLAAFPFDPNLEYHGTPVANTPLAPSVELPKEIAAPEPPAPAAPQPEPPVVKTHAQTIAESVSKLVQ